MDSLDLGALSVKVKADGVEKTQNDLNRLNSTIKQTESTTGKATGNFSSLGNIFKSKLGDIKLFGTSLGDMSKSLSGGAGMAGLLGGAIGALTVKLVELAAKAIQMAIQAMIKFAKQGVETASAIAEVQNVIDVTFGDGSDAVSEWAKNSADAFGLSELQAKKYAGTIGAILTPSGLASESIKNMSINLTQLSGDLASFWNKDTEQAFNALRSAITGETEPIKQFGIVMSVANMEAYSLSKGVDKAWQSMSQAEQATLRYNYILENTATAQGDFTRTQEEYANVGRQLETTIDGASAKLGEGLIPALTDAKLAFIDYINSNEHTLKYLGESIGMFVQMIIKVLEVLTLPFRMVFSFFDATAAAINPILERINPSVDKVMTSMDGVMDTLTGKVKKSNEEIKYSFEAVVDTANDTFEAIDKAYTNFKGREMKKYEESIRKSFATESLNNEKEIQRKLTAYERFLDNKLAKDADYERKRANLEQQGGSNVPKHATGTLYSKGGLALVGEHGRELVRLGTGDKVHTNTQTEQIINNNTSTSDATLINVLIGEIGRIENTLKDMPYKTNQINKMGVI